MLTRMTALRRSLFLVTFAFSTLAGSPMQAQQTKIAPFLAEFCVRCHGPEKQRGKLAFHELGEKPTAGPRVEIWKRILEQLESGEMPPEKAKQPASAQRLAVLLALKGSLQNVGVAVDDAKWLHPSRGNWVDHDALFSGKAKSPTATRGRLWRLTNQGYEGFILSLSAKHRLGFVPRGDRRVRSPWELSPQEGFRDYANQHRIGEPEIEHHLRNAKRVAHAMMGKLFKSVGIHEFNVLARADDKATPEQIQAAAGAAIEGILGRQATARELKRYTGFLQANIQKFGTKGALEQLLVAVLCHPEVMYRVELPPEGSERALLPPRDLARSIAYALSDHAPDKKLQKAVEAGRLTTREEVRAHVVRLLDEPQGRMPRILRFFREYFGYTKAIDVFKDETTRKEAGLRGRGGWQPDFFVSDTDRTILWILEKDKNVLYELLTTSQTFAATGDSREAQRVRKNPTKPFDWSAQTALNIYEIDVARKDWSPDQPYSMPRQHRMGILTHPSWLIAHSTNFDNHAIQRGHWIRERLLGGRVPDVPVTVDAQLPDEPTHTLRERMRRTRQEYCWKCHQQMDPLGLPFEQYDHFGRFRTTELDNPVDTTGAIERSGEAALDGPVKDPLELLRKLAKSKRVEQVFVRHAFRYFVGRNETLADGPVLVEAHRAYTESQGSMKALIASLLTSDAFLYRTTTTDSDHPPQPNQGSTP